MRRYLRIFLVSLAILIMALPLAAMVTLVLLPLFSWLEAKFHVEAVGHSGPAEWCYGTVYVLISVALFLGYRVLGKGK